MEPTLSRSPPTSAAWSVALLVLLGVIWGVTFPVARWGIEAGASPFWLFAADALVATGAMAAVTLAARDARPPLADLGRSAAVGALLIGGINIPLFWGEQFATGGAASIVYATSPVISFVLLLLLRQQSHLRALQAVGLALGLTGVVVVGLAAGGSSAIASPAALAAFGIGAVCQGLGAVLIGRLRPDGEHRWGQTFEFAGAAAVGLLAAPLLAPGGGLGATFPVLASVAYVGLLSLVVGYTIFFELIRRSGAVTANLVTFLNPLVALAVGVIAFGEAFQDFEAVGLGIVLVALLLLQPAVRGPLRRDRRQPARTEPSRGEGRRVTAGRST